MIGWLTLRLENAAPESMMTVKPEDLPAYIQSIYRLRPDRRFLYAVAELQALTSGGPRRGTLSIRFEESRWHVSFDGSPIGDLPEFPSLADAKSFLISQLRTRAAFKKSSAAHPVGAEERAVLENGPPADVFPALARLNAEWTKTPGDPSLVEASLDGLLWLALQSYDELELTDPILGKALALLAIAERANPGHFVRQECLLACLLGYEDHATNLARALPANDPVRLFAESNLVRLGEMAHLPDAPPRTEYLYLLRLAQHHKEESSWFREFEASSWGRRIDGPSLRLVLALDSFGERTAPATLMEDQVLEEVSPASPPGVTPPVTGSAPWRELASRRLEAVLGDGRKPPESRLSALEEAVDHEASRLDGELLDRYVVRAFRLANFYSSVYSAARYNFDSLGSTDGAEAVGNSLMDPPEGTAADLKDWILHRVAVRRSATAVKDVAGDLSRLRHVGAAPLNRIAYTVALMATSGLDPFRRAPVRRYFDRLDSRPSGLYAAGHAAFELFNDPSIVEQSLRLATQRGPRSVGDDLPWALRLLGDRAGLRALSHDKTWATRIRSLALEELIGLEKTEPREIVQQFRELLREDPAESETVRTAVRVLEKPEQIDILSRFLDEWLGTQPKHDLGWASVTSSKSRLLRKRGRFREALPIAQTAAETGAGECLEEEALALIDLGRLDEAQVIARQTLDQYQSESPATLLARILWMKGKDEEAGRLLTSPGGYLNANSWSSKVPSAFSDAFKMGDDARAEAAFSKLVVPGNPTSNLVWFVEYLTANGRADLAVKLCDRMRGRGPAGWATVTTYHALRKARSATAARDWLRINASPEELDIFSKQALQDADCELVWDLPDHPDPTKNEILYLIRAACSLYPPQASEERRAQLLNFFRSRPNSEFVSYGLFLLGQRDRPALFANIKDLGSIASVGWVLGLTSAHEGRFPEANAWLQVCMESCVNNPPRFWAFSILMRWRAEGGGMTEVARENTY